MVRLEPGIAEWTKEFSDTVVRGDCFLGVTFGDTCEKISVEQGLVRIITEIQGYVLVVMFRVGVSDGTHIEVPSLLHPMGKG